MGSRMSLTKEYVESLLKDYQACGNGYEAFCAIAKDWLALKEENKRLKLAATRALAQFERTGALSAGTQQQLKRALNPNKEGNKK